jgi:NTP pyrophosphatase (non-canonical NTP hydrolase)
MDFKEYQDKASTTAIYPEHLKILYPVIGLSGEVGEVSEKVKKVFRDKNGEISQYDRYEITKELGDVLWYLAAISSDLGISLEEAAEKNIEKLFSRKERNVLQGSGDNR